MKLGPFRAGNCGLCVVEDFVPIGGKRALVCLGRSYHRLRWIADVSYLLTFDEVILRDPKIVATGEYLRLGHKHEGRLIYSDGREKLQPFRDGPDLYDARGEPNARIYRNGELFISLPVGISQIGKPWVHGDFIYFEGHDATTEVPYGWKIFRTRKDELNIEYVCDGANPVVYEDKLYYMLWIDGSFKLVTCPLDSLS